MEQKPSYHAMLRTIGGILEAEAPKNFTIIEVLDGFTIILTPRKAGRPSCTEVHLTYETLDERGREMARRRTAPAVSGAQNGEQQPPDRPTRQDMLRAIGYELDEADGASIFIDELDEMMLLSYSYVNPGQGFGWHKRMIYLGPDEQNTIIETARSRRKVEPVKQRRILFRR